MSVVFATNILANSPKTVSLTGGLYDRLKGLSSYLRLCEIFLTRPVVIWDSPYHFEQLFLVYSGIFFTDRKILGTYPSYKYINLLHDRSRNISFTQMSSWFSSEEKFVMYSNKGLTKQAWEGLYIEFKSKFPHRSNLVENALPHQILFDDYGLQFVKPERRFRRVLSKKRVCFHFRIGGVQDNFIDPQLIDEKLVLSKSMQFLDILANEAVGLNLEIGITGDSQRIKKIFRTKAMDLGFNLIGYEDPILHLDRSFMIEPSTVELILQDIDLIASSDFLFTTAGAFGVMSAKYGKVPHGSLLNKSSIKACMKILTSC